MIQKIPPRALSVFLVLFVLFHSPLSAQSDSAQTEDSLAVNKTRLFLIGGVLTGTVVAVHLYQQAAWWQGDHAPFRFENDWEYALNIDKLGHFYGAYVAANIGRGALQWSNVPDEKALVYGSLLGLSYQLYVELEDGYHRDYGFSPGDAFSDLLGATFPLAQSAFPVLKSISFKWSYWPSTSYVNSLRADRFKVFIDDYEGQIYWMVVNPRMLLNNSTGNFFPEWFGVAFGAAVQNLDGTGGGNRSYYLSMDYQLSSMGFFRQGALPRLLLTALDFIHLPAPALAWEDGQLKFGIYYTYHVKIAF